MSDHFLVDLDEIVQVAMQAELGADDPLARPIFFYTSNVDGHLARAGIDPQLTYELHGSVEQWQCGAVPRRCDASNNSRWQAYTRIAPALAADGLRDGSESGIGSGSGGTAEDQHQIIGIQKTHLDAEPRSSAREAVPAEVPVPQIDNVTMRPLCGEERR
jgi:hypothetical protein